MRNIKYIIGIIVIILLAFLTQQWWQNTQYETNEKLFVYGTLKNPLVRFYACRCVTQAIPYTLSGYKYEKRNIYEKPNTKVTGYLLSVTSVELKRFDTYEKSPDKYQRKSLDIMGEKVWVYKKTNPNH